MFFYLSVSECLSLVCNTPPNSVYKYRPLVSITPLFRELLVAFSTGKSIKHCQKTDFVLQLVNWITANNH